ncbi:MAG: M16 family metallopeptidase [Phycisphaerales bacterium]
MGIEFKTAELDNGLRVIAEIDPEADTSASGFFVKTGARDETRDLMGVSHFLEHMMFKGTDRRSADELNREFDEIGANYNAFTSHEMTAFWSHTLPEYLPKALDLLADMLRPAIRESDFDTERGVILEEIAMYEDIPFWRLYEATQARFYQDHALGYRVLGTRQTIEAMKREEMLAYFQQRYSADNTTLALSGAIDFDETLHQIADLCAAWERTGVRRSYPEISFGSGDFTIEDAKLNRQYFVLVTPGPAADDERRYAANMLVNALGHHDGSILYWSLVDPGIAEEAEAGFEAKDRTGEMYVYASCPPERADQVEEIIRDRLDRLADLISEDDLERYRNKIATSVTLAGERPAGRMKRLGRVWTTRGEYLPLEVELERIQAVTLEEVRAVLKDYPFEPRLTARLRPPA